MTQGGDEAPDAGAGARGHVPGEGRAAGGVTAVREGREADGPVVVSPSVYRRLTSGFPGYTVAMLCCLVVVGLVLLATPRRNENAVPQADYRGDLTGLVAAAPYTVLAPDDLPQGWHPTSSRLTGRTHGPVGWHLGFYTPRRAYAALEESDERPDGGAGFVGRMTSQGRPDGVLRVAGADWAKTFREDKDQRSLVRRLPGVTVVVTGTASYEELAVLAGSLRPRPKPSPGTP